MKTTTENHQPITVHNETTSITIDAEGRWRTFSMGEKLYRRLVDGTVVEIINKEPQKLSKQATQKLQEVIARNLQLLASKAAAHQIPVEECNVADPGIQVSLLQRAIKAAKESTEHIQRQFERTYPEPVSMLPPDRYRDFVLLPATGCPNGKCSFCTLYASGGFRVLSPAAFEDHITNVQKLFGHALAERTGVFLGSASALSLSQRRLTAILAAVQRKLGEVKRGVGSFYDPYFAPKRTTEEYRQLRDRGLQQVTIGLESGSPRLREQWSKSGDLTKLADSVRRLKEARIQVALTILTSFHRDGNLSNHIRDTVRFVESLPLDRGDILYLSPLEPMIISRSTSEQQIQTLQQKLRAVSCARVVPYRVSRFQYYA